MTRDEIMNLYRKHVACELAHDSTGAASTYHVDGTYLHMPTGLFFRGRDAVQLRYAASYVNFPDSTFEIEGEVVEGDTIVHWSIHAACHGQGAVPGRAADRSQDRIAFCRAHRFPRRPDGRRDALVRHAHLCEQAGYDPAEVRRASAAAREQFAGSPA